MKSIFWHRRDLRFEDNKGLYQALAESDEVTPIFIFDIHILSELKSNDQRVLFIYQSIKKLEEIYSRMKSKLAVFYGSPKEIITELVKTRKIDAVYTNRDYEPYAQERDKSLKLLLSERKIVFKGYKDHVIFEKDEILKNDGKPYTVFTPYSKKWKETINPSVHLKTYSCKDFAHKLWKRHLDFPQNNPSLESMGFKDEQIHVFPLPNIENRVLENYTAHRNFPFLNGTSKLSIHLRFGTISIRELAKLALNKNETYLNELVWRDFYQMIIYHFPNSACSSFKSKYDLIDWENNEEEFKLWCQGKTGYLLVDAGMRELNSTGFMHNRIRMVVASFLTKHLLIDWRWGEAYFAEKLLDYELASNVGGWQWASGSGCDAAPYFRVFNPKTQQEKFDRNFEYIKKWVPEYNTKDYPEPIVDHSFARTRAIERYKKALSQL